MALTDEYPGRPKEPDHGELGNMSLWEHLSELRKRLIIVVIAVVVGAVVSWFFYGHIVEFMLRPYHHFLSAHEQKNISNGQLVISGPLEGFTTRLKVSVYAGLAVASPVIFWQLWRFITPGLHKNEKRYVLPFVSGAVVLFAIGVTTAVLIFPKALTWLIDVSGPGVVPLFSPSRYFTLYIAMCVIFGVVFMYPLVVVFLELAGVVPSATWRRWRRPAIVTICLVVAVITPSSDPFSFTAMAIPMLIFYEASILIGRALHK